MSNLYQIDSETKERIRKFRISTSRVDTIKALPLKIEPKPSYKIVIEEDELEELDEADGLADYGEALPDNSPRYVFIAYPLTNKDGIKQTPLILIYWIPQTVVSQEWKMLYAGALELIRNECGTSKLVEVTSGLEDDSDVEELIAQIETR
ncbi:ADF-H domain profile [Nakaseomyces glabratus]